MIYGYRLWAVDLHLGRQQQRHEFGGALIPIEELDDKGRRRSAGSRSVNYINAAAGDVAADQPTIHSFGMAKGAEDEGATDARGFSMRFCDATVVGTNLHLQFEHGLRHGDGLLIDPDDPTQPDVALKNKSTLHPYRATLVTGPNLKRAMLAVEARGRSCPMVSVVRGLNEINSEGLRLRVIAHLADEAAFVDYIRRSEVRQITFDRWAYDDDGAKDRREVSMGVMTEIEAKGVLDAAVQWCRDYFGFQKRAKVQSDVELANEVDLSKLSADERKQFREQARRAAREAEQAAVAERRNGKRQTAANEAAQLKQAVFADRKEDVSIEFNDVSVDLFNEGASKRIGPTSDFRRLTYGISAAWPTDTEFYNAAEGTATKLLSEVQGLPLD